MMAEMTLSDSLPLQIIDALDAQGIDQESYTLYEYLDAEALEELLASENASLEVRATIEGVDISITATGVRVLD